MSKALNQTLARMTALAAMAGLAALLANALASPSRKLAWLAAGAAQSGVVVSSDTAHLAEPAPQKPVVRPALEARTTPPAPPPRNPAPKPPQPETQAAATPIREISSQEAWEAYRSKLPFLDARRSADYVEGHITGAWSTPVWESDIDDRLFAFKIARRPASEDPIVIYCSGGDCKDSHLLATKLIQDGYFNILIYRDGFPDWATQKRPIEKGRP